MAGQSLGGMVVGTGKKEPQNATCEVRTGRLWKLKDKETPAK
jgi:hypothetical protein